MSFLIKHCTLLSEPGHSDVRVSAGLISEIGADLPELAGETLVDAGGAVLLPGLHDHHIHLVSLAASLESLDCGAAQLGDEQDLIACLRQENSRPDSGWLRGVGYYPALAGDIDRHWLDRYIPSRPVRIQHRGGRLWILNTVALQSLDLFRAQPGSVPEGVEFDNGVPTGRLYECDRWLRDSLRSQLPSLDRVSQLLASYGITGITDTTPSNSPQEWAHFRRSQAAGELRQSVRMMGSLALNEARDLHLLRAGEFKIHLLESRLPDFDSLVGDICAARAAGRNIAIHCVTHAELVFAIASLEAAGVRRGDRIEHSSVTHEDMLSRLSALGLRVVSQPHFILERGDDYLRDVEPQDQPWLYRLGGFIDCGVPLAAGSDAPFGAPNPWQSMAAAVNRRTRAGATMGAAEALTPELALGLYTSTADQPGVVQRELRQGGPANLCLLDRSWQAAREQLDAVTIKATWRDGALIYANW